MISKIKKKLLNIIKLFGYDLKGAKKIIAHNNFDAILIFLLSKNLEKKKIFFDVGANLGQSIERFKKFSKNFKIYSFEPTPALCEILRTKYNNNDNISINQIALGEEKGRTNFNSFKYHKINSILNIDQKSKFAKSRKIISKSDDKNFEEIIDVEISSIDDYCGENNINHIDLLKIDTQGFEDKVLKGSMNFLSKKSIDIIELELVLGFAYEKNLNFYDIEKILMQNDYKLIAIENGGNLISYSNLQTNLIYAKKELYEQIKEMHYKNLELPGIARSVSKKHPFSY
jgi:FkbM family methyltransferase